MSGWIRKNNNKRKLPQWMVKLECDERFVFKVPSLQQVAAASIVGNQTFLKFDEIEKYAFKHCAKDKLVHIVYKEGDERESYVKEIKSADYIYHNNCWYQKNIETAFPFQSYDVVHKSLVKTFPNERKLASCKRRLFD